MLNHKLTLPEAADEQGIGESYQSPSPFQEWIISSGIDEELAIANLQRPVPAEVLERLLGSRLQQLGAHSQQYVTAAVNRLLSPLEEAAADGWWCSGLDPDTDFHSEMEWGCWKPSTPRIDHQRNRPVKYEHPQGVPSRTFFLRVPAAIAQRIAQRWGVPAADIPADVLQERDGAFWRWWKVETRLPLFVTEGCKKSGSLLSAAAPAVALPGIWNGTVGKSLHPDLACLPLKGRKVVILFDHSTSETGRKALRLATRRLGMALEKVNALVEVWLLPGDTGKGIDDHLAAGHQLDELRKLTWEGFKAACRRASLRLHRKPDQVVTTRFLSDSAVIPADARLVGVKAPMGAGKTALLEQYLRPLTREGIPVVLLTHRRSLGAALSERLGVPFAEECLPDSPLRYIGLGLCVDSAHPGSAVRFTGSSWPNAVVVVDEVTQVLDHVLNGTTAVRENRTAVVEQLTAQFQNRRQLIALDALLDDTTIDLLEQLTTCRLHLIVGTHRPAADRQLHLLPSEAAWLARLKQQVEEGERLVITCTAQQVSSRLSAQAIADQIQRWRPEAKVLLVDSTTINNPAHHASLLPQNPSEVAVQYDYLVCSPAIETGVSIEDPTHHFNGVFSICSGNTPPEGVVQATARLRSDVDRFLFAPRQSRGNHLQVGNGSIRPEHLLKGQDESTRLLIAALTQAGLQGLELLPSTSLWMKYWAEIGARRNLQRWEYGDTVIAHLLAEGYALVEESDEPTTTELGKAIAAEMKQSAERKTAAEYQAVAEATPIDSSTAREWSRANHLNTTQQRQLQAHSIRERYGVEQLTPSLVEADRAGLHSRLQLRFWMTAGADRVVSRDAGIAHRLSAGGSRRIWSPDLTADTLSTKVKLLQLVGVPDWLTRSGEPFTADDPQLQTLANLHQDHHRNLTQVLGVEFLPSDRPLTVLRKLLQLVGYRLGVKRETVNGKKIRIYRVVSDSLPLDPTEVWNHWESLPVEVPGFVSSSDTVADRNSPIYIKGENGPQGKRSTDTLPTDPARSTLPLTDDTPPEPLAQEWHSKLKGVPAGEAIATIDPNGLGVFRICRTGIGDFTARFTAEWNRLSALVVVE